MQTASATTDMVVIGEDSGISAEFGISPEDAAHIMKILRDTLYTRKELAVLREYASNAWDEHRQAGIPDRPIQVTLPTLTKPLLCIRDFGRGLSEEDVLGIYTKYGRSTKRDTNRAVGFLGIGSKSGFCYSDQFVVISRQGGKKRTYVARLVNDTSVMERLDEGKCPTEDTGIEIQIAVRPRDIPTFHTEAAGLFRHYDPLPSINLSLPGQSRTRLQHGYVVLGEQGPVEWVAVMGCVPYRVDTTQAEQFLQQVGGALYFDIGEVDVSASREGLEYTDKTKAALSRKMALLLDEYSTVCLQTLHNPEVLAWEKRHQLRFLYNKLNIPLPEHLMKYTESKVDLRGSCFKAVAVYVHRDSCLVLVDDKRPLKGFNLNDFFHHLVTPLGAHTVKDVEDALPEILLKAELTGIPIKRLSSFPWSPYLAERGSRSRTANPKYLVSAFKLVGTNFEYPYSQCWDSVTREPSDEDVFVLLRQFEPSDNLAQSYTADCGLLQVLGGVMPPIYGYKTTDKRKVQAEDCRGTPYKKWFVQYLLSLMTPEYWKLVEQFQWSACLVSPVLWRTKYVSVKMMADRALAAFGEGHPISCFMRQFQEAQKNMDLLKSQDRSKFQQVERLHLLLGSENPNPRQGALEAREALLARYPLLGFSGVGIEFLALEEEWVSKWIAYIKMVDLLAQISPSSA